MTVSMKIMALCACLLTLTSAQFDFGAGYGGFGDAFLAGGGGSGGYIAPAAAAARDPRANPGPVVFPPSPPGDPSQTSGVVAGASGYGFVPPNSQGPAIPRFFYQGFYFR